MNSSPQKSNPLGNLKKRLFNSRFFAISALFHAVLVMVSGTAVLMNHLPEPPDFVSGDEGGGFVGADPTINTPPPPTTQQVSTDIPSAKNTATLDAIVAANPTVQSFQLPTMVPAAPVMPAEAAKAPASTPQIARGSQTLSADQAKRIAAFTGGWAKGTKGGSRWNGTGSIKDREFEFTAYLAKYAGGDWASTNTIKDGQIVKGSLPNLISFIQKFSKGKIKAGSEAVPLDLSKFDEEIAVKKPPFIFFTGHRDFVLTDKEVESLQRYVQSGGCIWGDSSLPGLRSRFDLAFRREMRRVIPDVDKDWEVLKPDYPLFTKNPYYAEVKLPPSGVNSYKESVYALRFGGEVAIIYTPNDYGDMWKLALDDQMKIDTTRVERSSDLKYSDLYMYQRVDVYFRGLELPRVVDSYKFGTNVVVHLLTRWEDRLKAVPTGL